MPTNLIRLEDKLDDSIDMAASEPYSSTTQYAIELELSSRNIASKPYTSAAYYASTLESSVGQLNHNEDA